MKGWVMVASCAALVALVTLAGCITPREADAASRGAAPVVGEGSFTLRVLVLAEPGGPPLEGALVGVSFEAGEFSRGGASGVADASGRVDVKVPPGRALTLAVSKPGWTRETPRDVARSGASGDAMDVVVPLYHEDVTLVMRGTLTAPAAASTRELDRNDLRWEPRPVRWSEDPVANEQYQRRLVLANATLTWTNGPKGDGDLLLAAGRSTGRPEAVQDSKESQFGPGEQKEQATVTLGAIERSGWRSAKEIYAGAGTGRAWAAPLGIEYTIVLSGHFDGDLTIRASPNGGLLAALIGLGAGALLLPRRPRRT